MLKYFVEIGYRKFIFTDQSDAIAFAKTAKLHSDEDVEVNINIKLDLVDQAEDQAE